MPTTNGHEVVTGLVLDGHYGWHNHARMIGVATSLGFPISDDDQAMVDRYDTGDPSQTNEDDAEAVIGQGGLMDDALEWLNDHTDGDVVWHWHDGEFFLSPFCEDGDCGREDCAHCWD
jgi:hypothetical protein